MPYSCRNFTPCVAIIHVVGKTIVLSNIYILMVNVKNNCLLPQESYHTKILHLRDMSISQFGMLLKELQLERVTLEDEQTTSSFAAKLEMRRGTLTFMNLKLQKRA